ncbi:MAG: sensor histidine kinase [Phocaeicola sp.]
MIKKRPHIPSYILLFSILGVLAYLLLANSTNLKAADATLLHEFVWGYLFFIAAFNALGFLIIRLSEWISGYMMQRWKMLLIYACVTTLLLTVNYGLLVLAKLLVGINDPLIFPNGGGRVLILLWLLELIIVGLLMVNQSVVQNMQMQQEGARLQRENDKARYAALQRQLNPHFLFNNLNTLIAEIEYNPTNAVLFTRNLSDAYRYVLQCQEKELITIGKEIAFMKAYVFLHQVRIGEYITVKCHIPLSEYEAEIPPLTLQLLIENVFKHNVISESHPIEITISLVNRQLVISNTLTQPKHSERIGTGLENLSNRCLLMMGKAIEIEKTEKTFTVKIPIHQE